MPDPTPARRSWRERLTIPRAELLILAGIASVTAGVIWLYPPAGIIIGGLALIAAGVGEYRAEARS